MRPSFKVALTLCVSLIAAALNAAPPRVDVMARTIWSSDSEEFGGISGLEVGANGISFTAVSDTGLLYRGTLERSDEGAIEGVSLLQMYPLLFEGGKRPTEKRYRDTEGLAISGSQTLHISAEGKSRVLRYAEKEPNPIVTSLPSLDGSKPSNMGFEALAITSSGLLVAIPEKSANIQSPYDVFQKDETGKWEVIYRLPRRGVFRPVGADFGPDGHLYVLMRAFNGFAFATRIERIVFKDSAPISHENIFAGRFGQFDNLEGLATWQAGPNDLRLVAISDDNFSRMQSTEIVEFRLQE